MKQSDKRDRIIQAALELIAEHGFHGTPMAMIAEHAGVAAGTIYRYFESKDILITELFNEIKERLDIALMEGYIHGNPIRERFIHLCSTLVACFIADPLYFRFMEQYFNSPFGASLRRDKILGKTLGPDPFIELIQEGIRQGVVKDLPHYVFAALTFSPLATLAREHNLGLIELDDATIRKSIEACWDSIKAA